MKAFEVAGELAALPLEHASFPHRCLGCGARADGETTLYKQRGFDLILHKHVRFVKLAVPACGACRSRKRMMHVVGWVPLIAVIAWWIAVGPMRDFRGIESQVDAIMAAAGITFLFGYYGARRFAERSGFGAWIAEMTPLGDLVTVRFRDWRDASEAADLSRKRAGAIEAPATVIHPDLVPSSDEPFEVRLSPQRLGIRLLIPVGLYALNLVMRAVAGFYYPVLDWLALALAVVFGVRLFDRRVRLRLDRDGFLYRPWGNSQTQWREIESARLIQEQLNWFVDVQPRRPDSLAARLPLLERISGTLLNSTRPRFAIDLTLLEGDRNALFARIAQRVAEHAPR